MNSNSTKNKRLCPNTPIALIANGDTFRVGYIERIDLFGNVIVNCDGSFEVWSRRMENSLFICSMNEYTQKYNRFNNEFVSLHQKEIAMYAVSQFMNKELRKQQHGSIYREELPDFVRLFDNDPKARFRAISPPNASNTVMSYDPSNWGKNTSAWQSKTQEQFRTHNFQQTPQFEEPGPDKSVTMKPVQSAPPGTFGKLYPEQWDMIQELILEARRVKAVLKNIEDHSSAVNETPEVDSMSLPDDELTLLIRTIFLNSGFTIKEGETDLKQYVFTAAKALIAAVADRKTVGR